MNRKTATEAFRRALRATLFAAFAAAPSASHGALRTWEPSDYQAQDAMILHFDGIRNAGLSEPHSATATSWINLADSERPAVFDFGSDESRWDFDGFYFGGLTYARVPSTALDTAVTVEVVSDIDTNVLISAYSGNYRQWPHIIGFEATGDLFDLFYHTTASPKGLCLKRGSTTFKLEGWDGRYAVGLINETKQVLVQNAAPNAATWGNTGKTGAIGTKTLLIGSANVEANDGINKRYLTGKIKALRLYNRVLTDAEIAANRAIDEARFFGAPPVTNAVVATSLAGAVGADASGAYAVDGGGYTFRAAPFATVGGTTYACTGCTVETSADGGATWGAPVACDGTYAVEVASADCKRITWQWAAASGTICGETSGYVQRGLALHYDGIRNAGAAAAHDASATAWTDLSGNGRHGTLSGNADGSSAWEDDGFRFNANAVFNTTAAFSLGTSFTAETLLDVAQSDATRNLQVFTMNTVAEPQPCYLYYHNGGKAFRLRTQAGTGIAWGSEPTVGGFTGGKATYVSAFRDGETDAAAARAAIAAGSAIYPAAWKTGSANAPCTAEIWRFGAARNAFTTGDHPMKGAIKSVRLYSRLLSEDECAWNRTIDSARYFGALAATNVVVAAGDYSGLDEDTAYQVFGSATFAAVTAADGSSANFVKVQTLQPDGTWGDSVRLDADSYTYTAGTSPATVKIDFRKTNAFVMVVR